MQVIIHKGSHEIGGTCIQISSGKTTILLDVGLPLSADSRPVDVSRLAADAVLISHSHRDHFGLMASLPPSTPIYMGKLARRLIDATRVFLREERYALDFHEFSAWKPTTIGNYPFNSLVCFCASRHSCSASVACFRSVFARCRACRGENTMCPTPFRS